jgi:hypothetical protein
LTSWDFQRNLKKVGPTKQGDLRFVGLFAFLGPLACRYDVPYTLKGERPMTPGDSLEYIEPERVNRFLEKNLDVRKAIQDAYSNDPNCRDSNTWKSIGKRLKLGRMKVGSIFYEFLLLRYENQRVSIVAVAQENLAQPDLDYYARLFE